MTLRHRAVLALVAVLGLILSSVALTATAASAGNEVTGDVTLTPTSSSGTATNGVGWTSNTPPNVGIGGILTFTFTEPVKIRFGATGLNCPGESIQVPDNAVADTVAASHNWNPATHIVSGNGTAAAGSDLSFFVIDEFVTTFTVTGVGAPSCIRALREMQVTKFVNATPTATIAAPIEGGVFTQGQAVLADYSCADADTVHVDHVDCVGDVADGSLIDTSTVGAHSFTVTATDEHGATSGPQTVNYTVKDQAGLCSGTAVGLPLNINLGSANAGQVPCVSKNSTLANLNLSLGALPFPLSALSPSLTVKLAEGTSTKAGNTHKGSSTVSYVKIAFPLNAWSLELTDLWSQSSASTPVSCAAGNDLQGTAEIGRVVRNGTFLYNQLSKPLSLPIPLLGGVYLNQVAKTGKQVSSNAVFVDLPGGLLDINIGSSTAGVDC